MKKTTCFKKLVIDPDILVLDEPAEGMDLLGTSDVLGFLKQVNISGHMLVLMISHHLDDVISAVDHLCFINQYANLFESGPAEAMISSEKLTHLYGRQVETHTCAGKLHIHVQRV